MGKTISEQSEVDEAAQLLLKDRLRNKWTVRERDPDIHIDYEIEHKTEGEPTALTAYVQLKGTRKIKKSSGYVSKSIKWKHLDYWRTCRRPVFIIIADVITKVMYYTSVLHLYDDPAFLSKRGKRNSVSIKIPETEILEPDELIDVVKQSDLRLRELFPSSPQAAIRGVEQKFEELDPRFSVNLSSNRKQNRFHITPNSDDPVDLSVRLSGITENQLKELNETFKWGKPSKLQPKELSIKGSPLFDEISKLHSRYELALSGNAVAAKIILRSVSNFKDSLVIDGVLSAGNSGVCFTSDASSVFIFNLTMDMPGKKGGHARFNISFDASKWNGMRLLEVNSIADTARICKRLRDANGIKLEVWINDKCMWRPKRTHPFSSIFESAAWWSNFLSESYYAAQYFKINPIIPNLYDLTDLQIRYTLDAIQFAKTGRQEKEYLVFEPNEEITKVFKGDENRITGFLEIQSPYKVRLIGYEIETGFLELKPSSVELIKVTDDDGNWTLKVLPREEPHLVLNYGEGDPDERD